MGSITRALTGGSKESSKSQSGNYAYDTIKNAYSPAMSYTTDGGNSIKALLGLSGDEGQSKALDSYANSAGYDFIANKGMDKITSNQAMNGLLRSGSTLKGMETFRQGLNSTFLQQFMDNLFKLSNLGLGAGGLISGSGTYSTGSSKGNSKGGLLPAIGSIIPG